MTPLQRHLNTTCRMGVSRGHGKTLVPLEKGERNPAARYVLAATAALLLLVQGCAGWPMYYYRNTPGGTVVVPAGQPNGYYRTAPAYNAPRGRR